MCPTGKDTWPEVIAADISMVRDADFAATSSLGQIAISTSSETAANNSLPTSDAAALTAQMSRSRLRAPVS
jgi:hypothetical protein